MLPSSCQKFVNYEMCISFVPGYSTVLYSASSAAFHVVTVIS